jgi:outer membrane protein
MMNSFRKLLAGALLLSMLGGSAFAQGKIGTVDLRKVFDNYWKKKQAEAQLKERQADVQKELKTMLQDLERGKEEYQSMLKGLDDSAVSTDEKDKRKSAAEKKLKDLQELQATGVQYQKQAESTLLEQTDRMRSNILADIRNIVNAKAKANGYSMVLDTAAETINKTPVFLFVTTENDLTETVLLQLNASAPTDSAKTDEKPAEEKKKDGKK